MPHAITLPHATRRAFDRMAGDLARVLGDRLVALVASGPRSAVAFVVSIQTTDLEALGALTGTWHHDGLDSPLLLTPAEFRRSLDTFPLEYGAIVNRHVVIAGTPPFDDLAIAPQHVRRACEVLAKAHLIHLRQGWIDAGGHDDALAQLMVESSGPLRTLLSSVAELHGHSAGAEDSAAVGARLSALDPELTQGILALDGNPDSSRTLVVRMPDYLRAAEQLWSFVDRWEA